MKALKHHPALKPFCLFRYASLATTPTSTRIWTSSPGWNGPSQASWVEDVQLRYPRDDVDDYIKQFWSGWEGPPSRSMAV